VVAEQLLYLLGYPIARTGVTLTVGPYQLMVADACSGLNSMYSLSSVGLLYLYFMQRQNLLRVAILAASILPIAYAANVVRVLVLSLLTYHFGESAGQGIVHDFASPLMFTVAVLLMVALDAVLGLVLAERPRPELAPSADRAAHRQGGHWMGTAVVSLGILASMPLAMALTPRMKVADEGPKVNLETLVPKRFGDWSMDTSLVPLQPDPGRTELINKIYNQTLTRTYVDAKGRRIMLSIAYGGDQRESMQVHKPEVCYPAQGFKVVKQSEGRLDTGAGTIPVNRLVAVQGPRVEPITYWMTIGDKVAQINSAARKLEQIKLGLTGRIPDGLLFRVSSITVDEAGAYQAQTDFVQALSQSLSEEARLRLMGHPAL
jgi:EpsI family protein